MANQSNIKGITAQMMHNLLSSSQGGNRRGAISAMDINNMYPTTLADWVGLIPRTAHVSGLRFTIAANEPLETWEWLVNSPYQIKFISKTEIEFLETAGAVEFKLKFINTSNEGNPTT